MASQWLLRRSLPALTTSAVALSVALSASSTHPHDTPRSTSDTMSERLSYIHQAVSKHLWPTPLTTCQCEGRQRQPPRHYQTVDQLQDARHFAYIPVPQSVLESSHIIYGQLLQDDLVESYRVYRKLHRTENDPVVVGAVQLGTSLNGHEGVVHGGILALLLDDILGFGFYALEIPYAVTANLNINYRRPVPEGSTVRIYAYLQQQEGRKLRWQVEMKSPDGKITYCDATSLFVIPKEVYENMEKQEALAA
jgi:uncharacterized protein (TIGR00369 family)